MHRDLGHVQFGFEIIVYLEALDYCWKGLGAVAINLVFIDMEQMEGDVIGICFNGSCKEAYVKLHFRSIHELKSEPKLLRCNAHKNDFTRIQEFFKLI